jgi:cysteine desulfurase/selenocysteine lyase
MMYDINKVRADFPILSREVHGKPLVYLDNAATTQKPMCVLDAMRDEYLNANANVHRGVHYLSVQATELHEAARETVRRFINARSTSEIVFTRGTTEGLNLVAATFSETMMQPGDEVIVSVMEHHSNIVPWQLAAARKGIRLRVIPMTDDGLLDLQAFEQLFNEHTKIVSVAHVSNVLGTVNPVKDIVRIAHAHGVPVMVDGAQSTPHFKVDMQDLDCDFFVFSGHKMYGPTGIGVLYGKEDWLDRLPPYQGGGEMIEHVSFEKTTFEKPPLKFEAGTPDYIASHGLATAIDYMMQLGMENIEAHERALTDYALHRLSQIDGMKIYGPIPHSSLLTPNCNDGTSGLPDFRTSNIANDRTSGLLDFRTSSSNSHDAVVSFNVGDIHHMDMGTLLDQLGIAVRTGHHCAQPLMDRLGVLGTVRASFALYNTKEEIDVLAEGIERVSRMF